MSEVTLIPKVDIGIMIEAEAITPDNVAGRSREEIERLAVWQGPREHPLSNFFDVAVRDRGSSDLCTIIIEGDASRVKHIGHGMTAGAIEIHGSAGMHLGAEMRGGSILVRGNAGSWAGMEMAGGELHIQGDAQDHIGSAYRGSWRGMSGGRILIGGDAKSQLGCGMVDGQIVVDGNVENFCALRQNGGSILVKGSALRGVGAEMTGGIVAVCSGIKSFTPGFVEIGKEERPTLGGVQLEGTFVRFSGDYAISRNAKGSLYCKEV